MLHLLESHRISKLYTSFILMQILKRSTLRFIEKESKVLKSSLCILELPMTVPE